ncbi:hypothetical protein APTSU1_001849500 [Apodemus speciosus]|uniref:Uncharacterized protein n=1 Tax=Apodemus speciosus TaxID=105296 RepID=A0ABQ0FVH3_APOSI
MGLIYYFTVEQMYESSLPSIENFFVGIFFFCLLNNLFRSSFFGAMFCGSHQKRSLSS